MTTCTLIERVAGNSGPDLFTRFVDTDLSGFTGISIAVRLESGGEINKDAVIDDAATGRFHIVWDATDLVEGQHQLEYVFVSGSQVTRLPEDKPVVLLVRSQV